MDNYSKYRGKCKEMSEALVAEDPNLTLVRGFYHCPLLGKEQHWWCKKPNGTIVDPTKLQFPSGGIKEFYEEFDGRITCEECGKEGMEMGISEGPWQTTGRYVLCSYECYGKLVGINQ